MRKPQHTSFLKSVAPMLAKLQGLKPLLLVLFALLISTASFSQNVYDNLDTTAAGRATRKQQINSLRKQVVTFIDEFADEEMFDKSLETRRLGKNRTLIDSLESYYDQIGIDFLTLTKLNINQFWAEAFSSRKAYSVNGKIDTLQLLNKTGRTVLFKLQIDSVTSMNDFKINSQVVFGESFKAFLTAKTILGLEAEINTYLEENLNKQTATSPDQYRQPVAATMSWIYQLFLAKIPTEARQELLNQRDAEDLADEVFTHAYTNFKVDFINPTYGIDSYKAVYGTAWKNNYQQGFLADGKSYAIPYVSINLEATENSLQAHFTNTKNDTLKIKHLRFKNKDGSYIAPNHITTLDDYTVEINLAAITSKDYLYACWGEKKLGKVRIQPFQPLEKKVMLVPVGKALNETELQAIQTTLDKVYKQAVCNWQVTLQDLYTPTETLNLIIPADEGLNQYSQQMRDFARTYATENNIQLRNTYLVFIIDGFTKETDGTPSGENGYMPRGRDLGFVTHRILIETKGLTLAHELGHGAFGLKHTWKDEGPAKEKTTNLMDYANGTHLTHKQWKAIHNPLPTISYLDKVEEGKLTSDQETVFERLAKIGSANFMFCEKCENTFVSNPSEMRLELPKNSGDGEFLRCFSGFFTTETSTLNILIDPVHNHDSKGSTTPDNVSINGDQLIVIEVGNDQYWCEFNAPTKLICDGLNLDDKNVIIDNSIREYVLEKVADCFENNVVPMTMTKELGKIKSDLISMEKNIRSTQSVEFDNNGDIYKLDNGELVKVSNPLSNEDILKGNWTDNKETKIRVGYNLDGYFQYTAIGIKSNLPIAKPVGEVKSGYSGLEGYSRLMTKDANAWLSKNKVKSTDTKYSDTKHNTDNGADASKQYLDGKGFDIDDNATFFKVFSEATGIGVHYLKTAEIEAGVYLDNNGGIINTSGLLTGTIESFGTLAGDIGSLGYTIFEFVCDDSSEEEVRNNTKGVTEGMNETIEGDETGGVRDYLKIIGEILLSTATGSGTDEIASIFDDKVDSGKRKHLGSRTIVTTVMNAVAIQKLIKDFPEMCAKFKSAVRKGKLSTSFTDLPGITEKVKVALRNKLKGLGDRADQFLEDFKTASKTIKIKLMEDPLLIDSWKKMDDMGIDARLRKNSDVLERTKSFPSCK